MKIAILFLPFLGLLHSNILWAQNQSIGNPPDWNWIQTIGGNSGADHGQSIVGDAQGNFFIGGDFSGTTQFDNTSLTTQGLVNGFVAKCDGSGAVLWTKQFRSSSTDGKVYVSSVTVDPNGNLVVLGHFRGGDLKLGTQTYSLFATTDLFLAKFGPNGALTWLITESTPFSTGLANGEILADSDGSIFALTSNRISKYSNTGVQIWEQFNPANTNSDFEIKGNTLFLAGDFYNEVQLGNDNLSTPGQGIFITQVDKADGSFSNSSMLASCPIGADLLLSSISMLNQTDFFLVGSFSVELSVDQFSFNTQSSSQYQYFVAKFENGACTWANQSTGDGTPYYLSAHAQVLAHPSGDAYFWGNKNVAVIAFGSNSVSEDASGFLAKIDGATGSIIALSAEPFFYNGWTNGQSLLQVGAPYYNIAVRSTSNTGSILLNRSFDSDSGFGLLSSLKTDHTGLFSMANVSAKTYFLGQENYHSTASILVTKQNHAGNTLLWQKTIEGATSIYTYGHSLWLDHNQEQLYLIGTFPNVFYYGAQMVDTSGGKGVFVAQMGTDGSFGWIKTLSKNAALSSVITDQAGNVIINGTFTGKLQLGNNTLTSAGEEDIFWAKLSASGQFLFAQRMGGEDIDIENYAGVDAQGNFYMSGQYTSVNIDFNGTNQTTHMDGDGIFYHVKFAPDGQVLWIKNFGNTDQLGFEEFCFPFNVEVDAAGNSYITGLHGKSNFIGPYHLTSPYFSNNFIAKINPSGNPVWVKSIRTKRASYNYCEIGLDETGDLYIGGIIRDSTNFDGTVLTRVGNTTAQNGYIAKIDGSNGTTVWAKTISGSNEAIAYPATISVYDHQSLFVGGHINDRLNFDAQSINTNNGRKGFLALIGQTIVVGTEQPSADAFFITVSPNPTVEQVTVSNASEQVNNLLLEIFDASGELVAKQTLSNFTGKTSFDLSASPAGVYFLKASSQDGQQILRVVKN